MAATHCLSHVRVFIGQAAGSARPVRVKAAEVDDERTFENSHSAHLTTAIHGLSLAIRHSQKSCGGDKADEAQREKHSSHTRRTLPLACDYA
jgi:hypothetical protein